MRHDAMGPDERLLDRPARVAAVAALLLAVAGVVVLVAADGGASTGIGGGLLAVGATVVTALAFYAVGRSEDRDRARGRT